MYSKVKPEKRKEMFMTNKKGACKRNEPGKRIKEKGYIFIEDNICHFV